MPHVPPDRRAGRRRCSPTASTRSPRSAWSAQTEQALTQQGTPYEVGIARYREIARGQLIADPHGLLKLLFHPHSRRLLGVHAIGTGATELIHIGQAVMAAGMPIDYFVESVFNYPDPGRVLQGRGAGWHQPRPGPAGHYRRHRGQSGVMEA